MTRRAPLPLHRAARAVATLAVLSWAAVPVRAQVVRGRVTEADGRTPVTGVVVSLVRGATRASPALTAEDGSFLLRAPEPGDWRVRADAVGYASVLAGPFALQVGDTAQAEVRMTDRAQALAAVRIEGETRCQQNPQDGLRTARIWESIRTALDASRATERERRTPLELLIADHLLDMAGRRRTSRRMTARSWSGAGFESLPAEDLAANGYIRTSGDSVDYFAPDATVLTSSSFLDAHCFRATERKPLFGRREIGLAFEPRAGHTVPDVEGSIWLDAETSRLRQIELAFRVPGRESPLPLGGARIEYERLPNGRWYVSRWSLRMPILREIKDAATGSTRQVLLGGREREGETRVLTGRDTLTAPRPALLAGRAFDSTTGRPLVRTVVRLAGVGDALTDADGRYRFALNDARLVPFPATLTLLAPRAEDLGLPPLTHEVTLAPGDTLRRDFAIPSFARVRNALCSALGDSVATKRLWAGALVGKVIVDETLARVADATVRAEWGIDLGAVPSDGRRGGVRARQAVADANGRYVLCGLPYDVTITVTAQAGSTVGPPIEVRLVDGWIGEETLSVPNLGARPPER